MALKILHTSDWHLGKNFRETNFDLLPIQKKIMAEIIDITKSERPQLILVAGDIFDTYNPSFDAERLFYETITSLSQEGSLIVAVAGNHDSPDKLRISKPLIYGKHSIVISGTPNDIFEEYIFENEHYKVTIENSFLKLKLKDENLTVAIKAVAYFSEVRMGLSGDDFVKSLEDYLSKEPQFSCDYFVFVSHLYLHGAQKSGSERIFQVGGIEHVPYEALPKSADYIALGHLHKFQKINNAVYSGSIYPFDAGEIEHKKGVCLWQEGSIRFIEFEKIPRIIKLKFNSISEAIKNIPNDENFYYLLMESNEPYTPGQIENLIKAYKDKLVGWQFQSEIIEKTDTNIDISSLSDEQLFVTFYRSKFNEEPDEELLKLFIECLEEARNATD